MAESSPLEDAVLGRQLRELTESALVDKDWGWVVLISRIADGRFYITARQVDVLISGEGDLLSEALADLDSRRKEVLDGRPAEHDLSRAPR